MASLDFVEGTTVSIAGTLGDGAVTMSRLSGASVDLAALLLPGDFWPGAGSMDCSYVIEDIRTSSTAIKIETGIGVITNNVLTRTKPRMTVSGTTVLENAPAAIQFGSAPTAGNVRIRIAPLSDEFMTIPPGINNAIGSDSVKAWQFSPHFSNGGNGSNLGNPGLLTEYYYPYYLMSRGAVGGFAIQINTVGTAGNGVKLGLYGVGNDGLPGNCITQANALAVNATGLITDTTPGTWAVTAGPIRLRPAWYYIALMTNDITWLPNGYAYGSIGGSTGLFPPPGRGSGYGWSAGFKKTSDNIYMTGLPTGKPNSGTNAYTQLGAAGGVGYPWVFLKLSN